VSIQGQTIVKLKIFTYKHHSMSEERNQPSSRSLCNKRCPDRVNPEGNSGTGLRVFPLRPTWGSSAEAPHPANFSSISSFHRRASPFGSVEAGKSEGNRAPPVSRYIRWQSAAASSSPLLTQTPWGDCSASIVRVAGYQRISSNFKGVRNSRRVRLAFDRSMAARRGSPGCWFSPLSMGAEAQRLLHLQARHLTAHSDECICHL
jgi:hypothetical protein